MDAEDRKIINEVYDAIDQVQNIKVLPDSLYNKILQKVCALERYLLAARKSRDSWRKKYEELKNGK